MENVGLYDKYFEHAACGVGFVTNISGKISHQIISDGITMLKNLTHRGAIGGDLKTGDGAGILIQIPHQFFLKECEKSGFILPEARQYGIGFLFLPQDKRKREMAENIIKSIIERENGEILGYRDIPVNPDCLGEIAKKAMPFFKQVFSSFSVLTENDLERKLYIVRKCIEKEARKNKLTIEDFYIPSFSSRTIVYKGMFVAPQFEDFYSDLKDTDFQSGFALIHQRYSTNTFPSWPLSQPFRYIAHNGEINTLLGNKNKMKAREYTLSSALFGKEIKKILPILMPGGSDSALFDNAFELLISAGRPIEHIMMMMIPEAFGSKYHISTDKRSFYEYHAAVMEPWDGPAAIVFTDGTRIGAALDRNGLRPVRYIITKSGKVVLASEVGVLEINPSDVLEKGRLGPGKIIVIDPSQSRVIKDNEIKATVSRKKPYRRWLEENRIELKGLFQVPGPVKVEQESIIKKQKAFGYTLEDINMIIIPMAENAQEPIGSMGNHSALSVLSNRPRLLYSYFKQLFAQVTNPPIDPYRENLVMSLMSFIGREKNLLDESPEHCHQLKLTHPVLTNEDMDKLHNIDIEGIKAIRIPMLFNADGGACNLKEAIDQLCNEVLRKIEEGFSLIILSDKDINNKYAPIPSLLATSAVHHYLVKKGKRHLTGLIIETGEVKEVMDFATLIGFGASAINPYLAFETISYLKENNKFKEELKLDTLIENFITGIKKGLLKIMSKMGVSTIRSYRGAQIFEAVGLNSDFINTYFPGVSSKIEGIGIEIIAKESCMRHHNAFSSLTAKNDILESGGIYLYRAFSEKQLMTPEALVLLQKATRENDYETYKKYSNCIDDQSKNLCTLRGLFAFKKRKSIPLNEVEPAESILKRFVSSAMSFGSISKEAHETIAIAMNRLGAQSNSGEGGEDESRYIPLPNGDLKMSQVKQVASGRFGVTSNYLTHAKELQIKMAQGAKPGEGGQLPGHKVNEIIAKVRHSTPGVMLISPPPHHDIYSIEDLSQLIYDLKCANPDARISVKLVSESGVGTIAAGVAKAKADMVLISGHDGGTGASPLSSIKYTGIPWEIGLAETQQTLVLNKLRDRIRIQVDGQIRTGRDIVIASLLGAEEFGFATVCLITIGCIMMKKCHLNTCPVGIATQDESLRKRFTGKPEYLINYMRFLAQEVREIMAEFGFKNMNEMTGHANFLEMKQAVNHWKAQGLDFSKVFLKPDISNGNTLYCTKSQEHDISSIIDYELIKKANKSLEKAEPVSLFAHIKNNNRAVGATLSYKVSKLYGSKGLPDNTIKCKFTGTAGQSFGAFLSSGITFELEGDANDYLGKGLSGGRIIIYPQKGSLYRAQNNIITGNVSLFGATSGEVYIHGMAGERFAVRNSGALAVVEGVGDHGCEYMTGGVVVILGKTGVNFAAGMSGGIAYVLDENQLFDTKCNLEMVDLEPIVNDDENKYLFNIIKKHVKYTESSFAQQIINDWQEMLPKFVKVLPVDYKKALERMKKNESKETEVVTITEEVYR